MIVYSIYDETGNMVEAYDSRTVALNAFARYTLQDVETMALIAYATDGSIIESFVFESNPQPSVAPPARPRTRIDNRSCGGYGDFGGHPDEA
jgi:hypothetical protein